jgi:HTH-type transcriptional regulator/antitoxin HigA
MGMNRAAETFGPGEFLKEELDARGWSQIELAEIIGRQPKLVNEIITGKRSITPETAIQLGEALGTGPELWMNLESQYQLSKVQPKANVVARRAALYERFPVREMIKRGWIEASESVEVLEHRFLSFFGISKLSDNPSFAHAAKKSAPEDDLLMSQIAWLLRARTLAVEQVSKKYSSDALKKALEKLSNLRTAPEEVRHVSKVLSECGVRFVLVEALPGSKIDGACFWITGGQPVIAMSLRLDRIDNFWFVLRHEIEHVLQGHGKACGYILDQDIEGVEQGNIAKEEKMANDAAADFCVDQAQLNDFVKRVGPYFYDERVVLFARRLGIHTGLVAGQLRKKLGRYDRWSAHLVKVRHIAIKSAPVDGWGLMETTQRS